MKNTFRSGRWLACLAMVISIMFALPLMVVAEHPDVTQARLEIEKAIQNRDGQEAMKWAEEIVATRPDDPDALMLRARLFMMMRQAAQAMQDIQTALKIDPHHPGATQVMATFEYQQNKKAEATARIDAALERYPTSVELITTKSDMKRAAGDARGAMQVLTDSWEKVRKDDKVSDQHKGALLVKIGEGHMTANEPNKAGQAYLGAAEYLGQNPQAYHMAMQQFEKAENWEQALRAVRLGIQSIEDNQQLTDDQKKALVEGFEKKGAEYASKFGPAADFAKLQEMLDLGWDMEDFLFEFIPSYRKQSYWAAIIDEGMSEEDSSKQLRNQIRMTREHWAYIQEKLQEKIDAYVPTPTEVAVEALLNDPGSPELEQAVADALRAAKADMTIVDGWIETGQTIEGKPTKQIYWEQIIPEHLFLYDQRRKQVWYEEREWKKARYAYGDQPRYAMRQTEKAFDLGEVIEMRRERTKVFPEVEDYHKLAEYLYWFGKYQEAANIARVGEALLIYETAHEFSPSNPSDNSTHLSQLRGLITSAEHRLAGKTNKVATAYDTMRENIQSEQWLDAAEAYVFLKNYYNHDVRDTLTEDEMASNWVAFRTNNTISGSVIDDRMINAVVTAAEAAYAREDYETYEKYAAIIPDEIAAFGHAEARLFVVKRKIRLGELEPDAWDFIYLLQDDPMSVEGHLMRAKLFEEAGNIPKALLHYNAAKIYGGPNSEAHKAWANFEAKQGYKTIQDKFNAYRDATNAVMQGGYRKEDSGIVAAVADALLEIGLDPINGLGIKMNALAVAEDYTSAAALAQMLANIELGNEKNPELLRKSLAAVQYERCGDFLMRYSSDEPKALGLAIAMYTQAIELTVEPTAHQYSMRGQALAKLAEKLGKHHDEALADLVKAIELGSTNPEVFLAQSKMLEAIGQFREASLAAKQASELFKERHEASGSEDVDYRGLVANQQAIRTSGRSLIASEEQIERSLKKLEEIEKENPGALEELNRAMEEARKQQEEADSNKD